MMMMMIMMIMMMMLMMMRKAERCGLCISLHEYTANAITSKQSGRILIFFEVKTIASVSPTLLPY